VRCGLERTSWVRSPLHLRPEHLHGELVDDHQAGGIAGDVDAFLQAHGSDEDDVALAAEAEWRFGGPWRGRVHVGG
jgi:hypothetical protein